MRLQGNGEEMITPELVRKLWAEALDHFGAKSVDKEDSDFMEAVGGFLDGIGVLDKEDFLERFTTTIGRTIYRPFDIGVEDGGWDLESQVMILTHELVHCEQYEDGPVEFCVDYVVSRSARADFEAKAYAADMEINYFLTGELYDIPTRAASLLYYGLNQSHVDLVVSVMESISETVVQGASVNDVAAWVLNWLEENGVEPN